MYSLHVLHEQMLNVTINFYIIMFLLFTVQDWRLLDIEELNSLPVDEQWFSLGQALGVSVQELENIQEREASLGSRKSKMFELWIQSDPAASYEKRAIALEKIRSFDADFGSSGYGSLQSSTSSVFLDQV